MIMEDKMSKPAGMNKKLIAAIVAVIVIIAAVSAALLLISSTPASTAPVKYVSMAVGNMKNALSTNTSIGGYISWEPFGSDGIISGVGHALKWSGEVKPDHPCCIVLVSNSFLSTDQGRNLTARFLKAHMDATDWINDALSHKTGANYTLLVNMAVTFTGRNASVVKASFEHVKYEYSIDQNMIDSIAWYAEQFINIDVMTNSSLNGKGYTSPADFAGKYINSSHLANASSITPSTTTYGSVKLGFLTADIHQMAQVVARNASVFGGKNLFAKYGVDVTIATGAPYSSGPTEMDNFANGNVDIGYLGAPPAILKHINNPGVQAKIVAQANTEGSALIVGPGINLLNDLRGKVVAIPAEGSIQYLLLQVIMRDANIPLVKA